MRHVAEHLDELVCFDVALLLSGVLLTVWRDDDDDGEDARLCSVRALYWITLGRDQLYAIL